MESIGDGKPVKLIDTSQYDSPTEALKDADKHIRRGFQVYYYHPYQWGIEVYRWRIEALIKNLPFAIQMELEIV